MSMMTNEARRYFSYLLRVWQVRTDGEVVWRASLEDPHTSERHGFASLEQLLEFLKEHTQGRENEIETRQSHKDLAG